MRRAALVLVALASCPAPYVSLTISDPDRLADQAEALVIGGERRALDRGFPVRVNIDRGGRSGPLDIFIEALGPDDELLARGFIVLDIPASGGADAAVDLRAVCARPDTTSLACVNDDGDLGVCAAGSGV